MRVGSDTDASLAQRELYNHQNKFFHAQSIPQLLDGAETEVKSKTLEQIRRVKKVYSDLAKAYAKTKGSQDIPLA